MTNARRETLRCLSDMAMLVPFAVPVALACAAFGVWVAGAAVLRWVGF